MESYTKSLDRTEQERSFEKKTLYQRKEVLQSKRNIRRLGGRSKQRNSFKADAPSSQKERVNIKHISDTVYSTV